jgi:hypothetical protein
MDVTGCADGRGVVFVLSALVIVPSPASFTLSSTAHALSADEETCCGICGMQVDATNDSPKDETVARAGGGGGMLLRALNGAGGLLDILIVCALPLLI